MMHWLAGMISPRYVGNVPNAYSNSVPFESLLYLFIEYVWDDKDGKLTGREDFELEQWIQSASEDTFAKKLSLRIFHSYQLIETIKANGPYFQPIPGYRIPDYTPKYAQIVCKLRPVLGFLFECANNVKYVDKDGRTILHVFLQEYLDLSDQMSQGHLARMHNLARKLMARGASFYALDRHGRSPLRLAAMCNNRQILQLTISCLADVNERDENGDGVVHIVIENCVDDRLNEHKADCLDIVRSLVFNGAHFGVKNKKGLTPVHLAAEKFHLDLLKFFAYNRANFTELSNEGESALHLACKSALKLRDASQALETIDLLLYQGCQVGALDNKGFAPLHYAVEFGCVEVIDRLIERGSDVDCRSKPLLLTPLHLAAKHGRVDVAKRLVRVGANVNSEAVDGITAIFMSALTGCIQTMEYLIGQGADVHRRDKLRGFTLLHLAASEIGNGDKKINLLIEKAFDVNDSGSCGVTPLHLAVLALNVNAVKVLIEHGANVNFQSDKWDLAALHLASMARNVEIVRILVDAKADVNCRGGADQWTPLHFVLAQDINWTLGKYRENIVLCKETSPLINFLPIYQSEFKFSNLDVARILIDNGADVNVKDTRGKTPLHLSTLLPSSRATKILLEAGAHANVQSNDGQLALFNALTHRYTNTLKRLLEFGASINDDDSSLRITMSRRYLRTIALEHAIKLKMLGLPIARIFENPIQQIAFVDFYEQCSKELALMRNHRVGDLSIYEFLHMNVKRQYFYVDQISSSYDTLERLFPTYFGIIRGACREATYRKSLLEPARSAWKQLSSVYMPDICVEIILSCVNNRYLEVLIDSARPEDKSSIDSKKVPVIYGSMKSIKKPM